jgi:single-strand DNA-binding protein
MTIEAAFMGTLGREAEVKTSKNGKTYLRANIRVGEGDAGQWISVMVFDTDTIQTADKMVKGARVYVEGKLSLEEWTAQDGTKKTSLSVMSWHCRLAEIGRNKAKRDPQKPKQDFPRAMHAPLGTGSAGMNDDIPF